MSLKKLLTSLIGGLLFLLVVVIVLQSYLAFKAFNYKEAVDIRKQQGISVSSQIDQYISGVEFKLKMLGDIVTIEDGVISNPEMVMTQLKALTTSSNGFLTYLVASSGNEVRSDDVIGSGVDTTASWYAGPAQNKKFTIIPPYYDETLKKLVSSYVVPIMRQGEVVAIIGLDITSDTFKQLVLGNVADGQVFVTDSSAKVLYAQSEEYLGKDFYQIRPMYKNFSGDYIEYQLDDDSAYVATKQSASQYGINVYTYEDRSIILAPSLDMLKESSFIAVIFITISLFLVYTIIVKLIYKPIGGEPQQIQGIIERIADRDLTVETAGSANATGIYASTVMMLEGLKAMVGDINRESSSVDTTSQQLKSLVDVTKQSSDNQISQMEMTATAMSEMVSTVDEVSRNAQQASTLADMALSQAKEGANITDLTSQSIQKLGSDISSVSGEINNLKTEVVNVSDVLKVIRDIADQTNLLALNAAIEAARAGEQGRGFAVVADEVRQLASRTQDSVGQIDNTITTLQQVAETAVQSMTCSLENTQETIEHASQANDAITAVLTSVEEIQASNLQIATASEEQSAVAQEINQSIVEVNELAKTTNEGADSTERSTKDLTQVVERLSSITALFKLSSG
ncbi:methyl-accepting chemotaxis protein [Vibrio sp. RC27]